MALGPYLHLVGIHDSFHSQLSTKLNCTQRIGLVNLSTCSRKGENPKSRSFDNGDSKQLKEFSLKCQYVNIRTWACSPAT